MTILFDAPRIRFGAFVHLSGGKEKTREKYSEKLLSFRGLIDISKRGFYNIFM